MLEVDVRITPGPLMGTVEAVASKSQAHRLLIAAALADSPLRVQMSAVNEDIHATARCLQALGARIEHPAPGLFEVAPLGSERPDEALLDCGESGTTLRFLLPVAAALGGHTHITGEGRLPQRPLSPLPELLNIHGCQTEGDGLPMTLTGKLRGGVFSLPGNISSQYVSGLLFALPLLPEDSEIILQTSLESAGYVEMSLEVLMRFGIVIHETEKGYKIPGNQHYRAPAAELKVEGDWSGAAFFLVAGAMAGDITCRGLDFNSKQGDRRMLDVLRQFGARIEAENGDIRVFKSPLRGCVVEVSQIPDLLPVLAALASVAQGETRLINAARLRLKESDRLTATAQVLGALGAEIHEEADALRILGRPELGGGTVDGFGDHRIVMMAAVAATRCKAPVTIRGAEAVSKSYPSFFDHFIGVGGMLNVL